VVPLGALVAGIGGVLVAGFIQHRLEDKRTAREDRLDQARADREEARELDRERRAENAEKRRVVGALRLAARKFDNARSAVTGSHISMVLGLDPGPSPEAVQLMATWMTPTAWAVHERTANIVDGMGGIKRGAPFDDPFVDGVYTAPGERNPERESRDNEIAPGDWGPGRRPGVAAHGGVRHRIEAEAVVIVRHGVRHDARGRETSDSRDGRSRRRPRG